MTDNPVRRAPPRISLSGREWKLYLVGGLGLAYAATLTAIAAHTPADAATAPVSVTAAIRPTMNPTFVLQAARAPRILSRTS